MRRFLVHFGLLIGIASLVQAQSSVLTVNPASREEVRQFYRGIYNASEGVPMGWTGSYVTGNPGDTSAAYKEATRLRINFFRALAGVPAGIIFNPTYSAKDQQAALMQSVNAFSNNVITLNHTPPASWTFYSAAGAEASTNSNLYYGKAGPDAISGYVADAGPVNAGLGHRRWLMFPQTLQMGSGDVPGDGTVARGPTNAQWIIDTTPGGTSTSPRPVTRATQVAYPPAGFVPYQVVWPRWSFSYPNADFSAATVTMTRAGQSIPVAIEPLNNGTIVGENTLVWVYNGTDSNVEEPHPRPASDIAYTVNVNNVRIAGAAQNFSYTVTVFDPDVPGVDFAPATVTGTASPAVNAANSYTLVKPSFASGFDWRTLQLSSFAKTYNAENGLDGLLATTNADYSVTQTAVKSAGNSAYFLTHPNPRSNQILQLPETFYISSPNAAITFASRLGLATSAQVATVQVSTNDGVSWADIYSQAGTSLPTGQNVPTEAAFSQRSVSLASLAGRTVQIRFNYTARPDGSVFGQTTPALLTGWFLDDITLVGVLSVTAATPTRVASGNAFSFTPSSSGAVSLQARGVLFGAYPIEWGPVAQVAAIDSAANNNPGRLINMSIRTNAGTGDNTLIVGVGLGGTGTNGNKAVLLRAVGPTLGAFGVGGALADSVMTVFQGSTQIAQNDDWAGGFDFGTVGAFAFSGTAPRDSAIYNGAIASGSYSIQITGKNNGTGVALAEIYDATPSSAFTASTPRLANVSARTQVGTGDNILIAGFVVGGGSPVRVLVRATGPTLGVFGVGGVLADPKLTITNASAATVAENDNWGGTTALKDAFGAVGAFGFSSDTSRDAAVIVSLEPGSYTAQVTGVGNTTGVALVEVYELP